MDKYLPQVVALIQNEVDFLSYKLPILQNDFRHLQVLFSTVWSCGIDTNLQHTLLLNYNIKSKQILGMPQPG